MSIERIDPDRIMVLGADEPERAREAARFVESDFRIRSGLCPNGCGLLTPNDGGQDCAACGFWCNTKAEAAPNG